MSSGLSCTRWGALLALAVVVSNCGQHSNELVLEPLRQLTTTGSATKPTLESVPTPSIPAPLTLSTSQQIAAEFTQLINLRVQCGRRPVACPISQLTAPESKYRRYLTTLMKIRADANLATRFGIGKFRFRIENIDIVSSSSAVVHTCIFDSLVVFDSGQSDSTRDDIVFDDDVISGHTAWKIVIDDGKWKWSDATGTDTNYGKDICGFAS
ncbi:MAG: hypothetical protein ACYC06_11950 [Ilumatobacteraceae bacterium]